MYKQQYRAYASATQTVAKTRQIIMLYDAAIRNLQQARDILQDHSRIEERFRLLSRANEIVYGLQGCLDFDNGGEVAKVLYDFYSSVDARILSLHRLQNPAVCDQLIKDMKAMRDTWDEIDRAGASDENAPPAGAVPPAGGDGSMAISA